MTRQPGISPGISKAAFCKALQLIRQQEAANEAVGQALAEVCGGSVAFGCGNRYQEALLLVLKEAVHDPYDYIDWWLWEAAPDYTVWSADESQSWCLKDPGDLYDYLIQEE